MRKTELSKKNEQAIEDFYIHEKAKITNHKTLQNRRAFLRMFLNKNKGINKDYDKINQLDIDLFFGSDRIKPTTREVIKPILKKFLKN